MQRLKILQLGDIHLAPEVLSGGYMDLQDSGFPTDLAKGIAPPPKLQASLRAAVEQKVDALLICGDITEKGNADYYRKGVQLLVKLFNCAKGGRDPGTVHSVPGNHDLPLPIESGEGEEHLLTKFVQLEDVWIAATAPVLAARSVRQATIERAGAKLRLLSLNSCIGCGEERYLPEKIRKELAEILKASFEKEGDKLQREQLNTPAFLANHLDLLMAAIDSLDSTSVAVVLAHHNLLPQAEPRLELYTELLNGGLLREKLARAPIPIIYCHGHIHEDPIELIQFPDGVKIISVSAPKLDAGFNVIDVEIGSRGFPLGCTIRPFRWNRTGSVQLDRAKIVRVAITDPKRFHEIAHSKLEQVLQILTDRSIYFSQFAIRVAEKLQITDDDLAEILLEAEWLGFVGIKDRDRKPSAWTIDRTIP